MVYYVVYVVGLEFMKDWHGYTAVSYNGQEHGSPVCTVTPAQGYLVSRFYSCVLE